MPAAASMVKPGNPSGLGFLGFLGWALINRGVIINTSIRIHLRLFICIKLLSFYALIFVCTF